MKAHIIEELGSGKNANRDRLKKGVTPMMSAIGAQTTGIHTEFSRKEYEDEDGNPLPDAVAWRKYQAAKKSREEEEAADGHDDSEAIAEVRAEMREIQKQFEQNFRQGGAVEQRKEHEEQK